MRSTHFLQDLNVSEVNIAEGYGTEKQQITPEQAIGKGSSFINATLYNVLYLLNFCSNVHINWFVYLLHVRI